MTQKGWEVLALKVQALLEEKYNLLVKMSQLCAGCGAGKPALVRYRKAPPTFLPNCFSDCFHLTLTQNAARKSVNADAVRD